MSIPSQQLPMTSATSKIRKSSTPSDVGTVEPRKQRPDPVARREHQQSLVREMRLPPVSGFQSENLRTELPENPAAALSALLTRSDRRANRALGTARPPDEKTSADPPLTISDRCVERKPVLPVAHTGLGML